MPKASRGIRYWSGCGLVVLCAIALLVFYLPRNSNEKRIVRLVSSNLQFLNECVATQNYDREIGRASCRERV